MQVEYHLERTVWVPSSGEPRRLGADLLAVRGVDDDHFPFAARQEGKLRAGRREMETAIQN